MSGPARLLRGASYLFRGLGTLLSGRGLMRWALLPIVLNLFLFVLATALAVWAAAHYTGSAAGDSWWSTPLSVLAALGVLALLLVVGFFTFGVLAALLAAPFNEILSQSTERLLTGRSGEAGQAALLAELCRAMVGAGKLLGIELAAILLCLPVMIVPVVGTVLGPVLFTAQGSFFLALSFMDYSLDRRRLGARQKLAFCRRHLAEVIGFGLLIYAAMLLPLVNILAIPVAAVGGTRLVLDLGAPVAGAAQSPGARSSEVAGSAPSSPGG
jgi:CysZ protein